MSDVSFYGVFDFALWLKEKLLFSVYFYIWLIVAHDSVMQHIINKS